MKISIVLPVYNESGSLAELYQELSGVLAGQHEYEYEIIMVNDGSQDESGTILETFATINPFLKVIHLRKNYGQTAALAAGFDAATGDVIISMDADLQNDPHDIPRLLAEINTGVDVVSGWRKNRMDSITRRVPSVIANKVISYFTSVRLHDYGCTLKAYRRELIKDVRFYGEMHRFMPAYARWYGAKISELVVNHRPRKYDTSKYGLSRTFRVILDLLTVKFLMTYLTKPMHFFGGAGFLALTLGMLFGGFACYLRLFEGIHFIRTPLPLLSVFFTIMGIQFILMGILAEILIRIYHEPLGRSTYAVRKRINFEHE